MTHITTVGGEEVQVFEDEEIRDTNAHNSTIVDARNYSIIVIYVDNDLDQVVSIQVKANRANSTTGAVDVGAAFSVAATNGVEARVLTPDTAGWLPYVYVEATCTVAPTSGNLNCYIIRRNY